MGSFGHKAYKTTGIWWMVLPLRLLLIKTIINSVYWHRVEFFTCVNYFNAHDLPISVHSFWETLPPPTQPHWETPRFLCCSCWTPPWGHSSEVGMGTGTGGQQPWRWNPWRIHWDNWKHRSSSRCFSSGFFFHSALCKPQFPIFVRMNTSVL